MEVLLDEKQTLSRPPILKVKLHQSMSLAENILNDMHEQPINLGHHTEQLWYQDQKITNLLNIKKILKISARMLSDEGFKIDSKFWFMETHIYNVNNKYVVTPFSWHQDDSGGWPEQRVNTILWYIERDDTLKGGNLLWSLDTRDPEYNSDFNKYKLNISTGMVVMMRGDTWHCPEDVWGKGIRKLLVIQFRALD
jgi:hypothetical protein